VDPFGQEDTPGRRDVAAAPWLISSRASIGHLIAGFEPYFTSEQWTQLGRIVPLTPSEPFVEGVTEAVTAVEHAPGGMTGGGT